MTAEFHTEKEFDYFNVFTQDGEEYGVTFNVGETPQVNKDKVNGKFVVYYEYFGTFTDPTFPDPE